MLSFKKPQLRVWFFSAEVSRPYKTQSRLNPAKTSNCPRSSVISTLAQPILALAWELPSTLTSPDGPRTASQLLRTDVKYWAYNPVEPVVNLVDKLVSNLILINVKCTALLSIIYIENLLHNKQEVLCPPHNHDEKQWDILLHVYLYIIKLHVGVEVFNKPVMSQVIPTQEISWD